MEHYFGDNQYQGVSHLKGATGIYQERFSTVADISDHLSEVCDLGTTEFAFTCTARMKDAVSDVCKLRNLNLHPCLPYAHDVNSKISSLGLPAALRAEIASVGARNFVRAIVEFPVKRYQALWEILIVSQLSGIEISKIKSVGLLNVAFDFLLGLGRYDVINAFHCAVKSLTGKNTWFYTMNCAQAIDVLTEAKMTDATVVSNINTAGFRMNPSQGQVLSALKKANRPSVIAMSVFAGEGLSHDFQKLINNIELQGILFGGADLAKVAKNIEWCQTHSRVS